MPSPMKRATIVVRRLAKELRRGRELQDLAAIQHGDAVGKRHRLGLIVRDVDHRRAGARVKTRELGLHGGAQMHVEIGERLVEQHERGLGDEAAGERDALALAAGQHRRAGARRSRRGRPASSAASTRAPAPGRARPRPQPVADVLGDAHVRPQRIRLEHDADAPVLRRHVPADARHDVVADEDAPARRPRRSRRSGAAAWSCRSPRGRGPQRTRRRRRRAKPRRARGTRRTLRTPRDGQSRHGSTPCGRHGRAAASRASGPR